MLLVVFVVECQIVNRFGEVVQTPSTHTFCGVCLFFLHQSNIELRLENTRE